MDKKQSISRIYDAVEAGNLDEVKAIIGNDTNLRDMDIVFGTWLHMAAGEGHLPIVRWLVEIGADVDRKAGILGGNALNEAASKGHLKVITYLLGIGSKMDVSESQLNPLFSAIFNDHRDVVKLLLKHGIDATIKYSGRTVKNMDAHAFAKEQGRREIAAYIQEWIRTH